MKNLVALLGALAAAALLPGQSANTTTTTTPPAPTATNTTAVKPATAAQTATTPPKPAKPPEKEEPKIPGIVLQRPGPDGKQLGLTISNGTFKLSFYDKKRKAIAVDVTRARATWHPTYKAIPEATILNIVDGGKALGGGKPVLPPYAFVLHLTLFNGDSDTDQAKESYTISIQDEALKANPRP